ncbi:MAG TPA: polysaccharide deacetylase family protein [Tissierellia bacterium]|jgi:peptidoglycan/xylan/chitin deacetylase (PgdA/CDA1 family)|nr:polysaccharide deacetylase family protein [Tissierellia bacterium]
MKSTSYIALAALTGAAFLYGPLPTLAHRMTKPTLKKGEKPRMLLSFDDGPSPRNTPRLLDTLKEYQVPAVFFVLGDKARFYPQLVRRMVSEGHSVGFHAHVHRNQMMQNPISATIDFERGLHTLRKLVGSVRFYRPPHGCFNVVSSLRAKSGGLIPLMWHRHVRDWKKQGVEELLEKLREARRPGAVLLLHDASDDTGGEPGAFDSMHEALKIFLSESLELGYDFVGADAVETEEGQ